MITIFWRCLSYIIPKTVDIHTMLTRCFNVSSFRKRKQFRRFVGRPTKLLYQVQNHNCLISVIALLTLIIQMLCKISHTALNCFMVLLTLLLNGNLVITMIIHDGMNIKTTIVIALKMIGIILVNQS